MFLVIINLANLWLTGHVPRIVRVASMYSLSPTVVLRRVVSRRLDKLRQWCISVVGLDRPRVWPSDYRAILEWRATEGRPPATAVPPEVALAVNGVVLEMSIEGGMPTSTCFLQVRLTELCPAQPVVLIHSFAQSAAHQVAPLSLRSSVPPIPICGYTAG